MKNYLVKAKILDEVCLAQRGQAANIYYTLDYIPGGAWWGATAALTGIRPGYKPSDDFIKVFYSGEVMFSNLYLLGNDRRSLPVPLSARTRKHRPGFTGPSGAPVFFEVTDQGTKTIAPGGVWDWLLNSPQTYQPDWRPVPGWYVREDSACEHVSPVLTVRGHNAMSGPSGTTREGQLFQRQNIARGQQFCGFLRAMTDEAEQALERLLNPAAYVDEHSSLVVSLGRQPGTVGLTFEEAKNLEWQNGFDQGGDVSCITVTLLSDAILLDERLRYPDYLSADEVAKALGPGVQVTLMEHFSASKPTFGWNGAYSRPREIDLALTAGSAFCYFVDWNRPSQSRTSWTGSELAE